MADPNLINSCADIKEEWRPVVGFEGFYEVSDLGRVKVVAVGVGRRQKIMKLKKTMHGYFRIALFGNGKKGRFYVHRLVASAFLGPMPPDFQVNHISGNKEDNRPRNLEYVTASQNQLHSRRVLQNWVGERHHKSKLTSKNVVEIRERHLSGESPAALAQFFGVCQSSIHRAVNGTSWLSVPQKSRS